MIQRMSLGSKCILTTIKNIILKKNKSSLARLWLGQEPRMMLNRAVALEESAKYELEAPSEWKSQLYPMFAAQLII